MNPISRVDAPLADSLDPAVGRALRSAMTELVSDTAMPAHLVAGARSKARRITFHRRLAAAAIVAALVAGGGVGVRVMSGEHAHARVATAGLLPDWPQRGADAADGTGLARVIAAWDAATHDRHTLKAVLFAGRDAVGSAAIVLATDSSGQLRLGGLTGDNPDAFSPTKLVVDNPVDKRPVAAFLLHNDVGRNPVLIAVTDPRYTQMSWTQAAAMPDRPTHEALTRGVDMVSFFDVVYVPKSVTFSGAGMPDVNVPVG
jgi:hypothetical protein